MSGNKNLAARFGVAAFTRAISTIAAGLRSDAPDVLELSVNQVCRRTIAMLRSSSPFLDRFLKVFLPFCLLGVGISQFFVKWMSVKTFAQQAYASVLSHITVPGANPLNKQICAWMAERGLGQNTRTLTISAGDEDASAPSFLPSVQASVWFKFNGVWLRFSRIKKNEPTPDKWTNGKGARPSFTKGGPVDPDVSISCVSVMGSVKSIKGFLEHVQTDAKAKTALMMKIVRWSPGLGGHGNFDPVAVHRPARKLDSVSMEAAKKTAMVDDMAKYLVSQRWYTDRGIPWRRGYLFYGPPGTGKTSVSSALAAHFCIELHMVGLSAPGMNDTELQMIFDDLPEKCVVLLEDLDSAGIGREKSHKADASSSSSDGDDEDEDGKVSIASSSRSTTKPGVTLSGLLNAIDGPASHEGRILICTTNSPDSLDPALVRPGRIDMKILFGNASPEVSASLFLHIFEDPSGEVSQHDLTAMAKKFANCIPDDQLSPAEVQNYLLAHRADAVKALEGAAAWAKNLIDIKSQGVNVARFNGQI